MYILLCGHPPFSGENDEQTIGLVKRARVVMEGLIWIKISPDAKNLIEHLICFSHNRYTVPEALKHP